MRSSPLLRAGGAVLLWSTSAAVTNRAVNSGPPLLVVACSFTIATLAGALVAAARGRLRQTFVASPIAWLLGLGGLCSYYLAYNFAFTLAPPIEVNLLNYLWPLLTVVLSAPLLGTRWSPRVLWAGVCGLAGAALVITQGHAPHLQANHLLGYLLALWAGVSWAVFSCLQRRYGAIAAGKMPLYCGITAAVAWLAAILSGDAGRWEAAARWLPASCYLGVAPLMAAFHLWDSALQTGDVARVAVIAYLTPCFSTLLLALDGVPLTAASLAGMVGIVCAAVIGSLGDRRSAEKSVRIFSRNA